MYHHLKVLQRRLRLVKFNRNFLVFLVFLAISIAFWFTQSLLETKEGSITYTLKVEDVPTNVIFTSDLPKQISVNYTGKVWNVLYHKYLANENHEVALKFKDIDNQEGQIIIDVNTVKRAIGKLSHTDIVCTSISPNKIEVYYSYGQHKRVPVIFGGEVKTAAGRTLCKVILTPDSVDVFAPDNLYGSIQSITTEKAVFKDVNDTLVVRLAINTPHGVKAIPDSVKATFCVDIFTDKTLQVPITSINVPENYIMRTFPIKTDVTFVVSSTLCDKIKPEDFTIIADYAQISSNTNRCKVYISQQPENISNIRISPEYVDFIIEEEETGEGDEEGEEE